MNYDFFVKGGGSDYPPEWQGYITLPESDITNHNVLISKFVTIYGTMEYYLAWVIASNDPRFNAESFNSTGYGTYFEYTQFDSSGQATSTEHYRRSAPQVATDTFYPSTIDGTINYNGYSYTIRRMTILNRQVPRPVEAENFYDLPFCTVETDAQRMYEAVVDYVLDGESEDVIVVRPPHTWDVYLSQADNPVISIPEPYNIDFYKTTPSTTIIVRRKYAVTSVDNIFDTTYESLRSNVDDGSIIDHVNYYGDYDTYGRDYDLQMLIDTASIGNICGVAYVLEANNIEHLGVFQIKAKNNSVNNYFDNFDGSNMVYHMGFYEPNEDYTNPTESSDTAGSPTDNSGVSSNGVGTRQYAMSTVRFNALCEKLWYSGIFDNLSLINNSPIENVLSCKMFPFSIYESNSESVHIGNIDMEIDGFRIPSNFKAVYEVASGTGKEYYGSFLDYDGFTRVSIWLPYIGIKELSPSIVIGKQIKVYYTLDLTTGRVGTLIYADGKLVDKTESNMGIDVPLSASNRAQVEAAQITSAVHAVADFATQDFGGAFDSVIQGAMTPYHSSTSGSVGGATSAYDPNNIYLIYERPIYQDVDTFRHTHGRACNLSLNLSSLTGFTMLNNNVDLSGVNTLNSEELDELRSILSSGFFL